jgi:hypothetical protein
VSRTTIALGAALALCVALGTVVLRGWLAPSRSVPVAVCPAPPSTSEVDEVDEVDELAVLLDLAHATALPTRLACSLPAEDDDAAAACQVAASRAEAGLVVAEAAVRLGAVAVARQQLPAVRALVTARGLAAPVGSR